jgi:hypothetical protein
MKRFLAVTLSLILCLVTLVAFAATKVSKCPCFCTELSFVYVISHTRDFMDSLSMMATPHQNASMVSKTVALIGMIRRQEAQRTICLLCPFTKKGLIEQLEYDGYTKAKLNMVQRLPMTKTLLNLTKPG